MKTLKIKLSDLLDSIGIGESRTLQICMSLGGPYIVLLVDIRAEGENSKVATADASPDSECL